MNACLNITFSGFALPKTHTQHDVRNAKAQNSDDCGAIQSSKKILIQQRKRHGKFFYCKNKEVWELTQIN